ncbi:hypothetical protein QR680_018547 [Steinernema hermaphroditum]|uniref:Transmembrane protein n=1 Tax=Steinernema hermaphroditum TaxID=289476 RepID=A0AA39HKE1_9BILA|nr:hypothetical protein QR680_018547 [Steinernema hermaphroditum]
MEQTRQLRCRRCKHLKSESKRAAENQLVERSTMLAFQSLPAFFLIALAVHGLCAEPQNEENTTMNSADTAPCSEPSSVSFHLAIIFGGISVLLFVAVSVLFIMLNVQKRELADATPPQFELKSPAILRQPPSSRMESSESRLWG